MFLRASFDDSGTHLASAVVVWGGVIGEIEHFSHLEAVWGRFLASPVEERAAEARVPISQTFQIDNYGLQAADCIATETYWLALEVLRHGTATPDAQQRAFFGQLEPLSLLMTEDELAQFAQRVLAMRGA